MLKKGIIVSLLVLVLMFSGVIPASAKTNTNHDYILENGKRIPIPQTHEFVKSIKYIDGYTLENDNDGLLNNPQDLDLDSKGNIYIADTGNNAILKLNSDGKIIYSITEIGGKSIDYPLGVFVDNQDEIFFSDNGNKRIVHISSDGKFIEEFTAPESELLSQNLAVFDPSKILISETTGFIYVLIGKEFMQLNPNGSFEGLVGTEPVGFDLIEWLSRIFQTKAQKEKLVRREPLPYNNFCITDNNIIYAVSNAGSNQIKRINVAGDNTFPSGFYGETSKSDDGTVLNPSFSDISVNSYGIITVVDQNTSLLYQYNGQGELLGIFGGKGSQKLKFENVSALCYDKNDNLYVLDSSNNCIQVLETTAFTNNLHNAMMFYLNGDYDDALVKCNEIINQIGNYPIAQKIVADIYNRNGNYEKAMEIYKTAGMQDMYGAVLKIVQNDFINNNFFIIIISLIIGLTIIVLLLIYMYRYSVWIEEDLYDYNISKLKEFRNHCHLVFFRPIQGWDVLKWRRIQNPNRKGNKNLIPVILLPLLFIIARYIYSKYTAFTVNLNSGKDASFLLEFIVVLVVYVTLGLSIFKITTVLDGEISLYETFASMSYSLVPPIILLPIFTIVSHIVTADVIGIYQTLYSFVYVWMILLIISAIYRINDVSIFKTAGHIVVCVIGTLIVWAMCILIYIFGAQVVNFAVDLFKEILWRIN